MFDAEVISVGDELTSGQRLDTNSQWLSQRLGEIGVRTVRHTTVGDDLAANVDAFRQAASRARFIVISGGLGPTLDDLTREALAQAFSRPLELHQPSLERIEQMFVQRKRPMPERNRVQAYMPTGSLPIPNPHGTAPGIDLSVVSDNGNRCRLFALPGVPAELTQMWGETVQGRIEAELGSNSAGSLRYHAIKVYGIGESDVEVKLPTLIARSRVPTVGITVSRATITLRIAGRSHSDEEFAQLIAPTVDEIQAALGDLIFGTGEDELEHAVARQLLARGLTMASVEVGASSLIPDWMLAAYEQSDRYFAGALSFPSVDRARRWMRGAEFDESGIKDSGLKDGGLKDVESEDAGVKDSEANTMSESVCVELAEHVRSAFGADVGLAIGVYPTPQELAQSNRVFEVMYAISLKWDGVSKTHAERRALSGHPEVVTARIAKSGLDIVRRQIGS